MSLNHRAEQAACLEATQKKFIEAPAYSLSKAWLDPVSPKTRTLALAHYSLKPNLTYPEYRRRSNYDGHGNL